MVGLSSERRVKSLPIFGLINLITNSTLITPHNATFAVGSSASFDETLVEAEVVSDAVTPGRLAGVVAVRQPACQDLVDVTENQALLLRRQDCH